MLSITGNQSQEAAPVRPIQWGFRPRRTGPAPSIRWPDRRPGAAARAPGGRLREALDYCLVMPSDAMARPLAAMVRRWLAANPSGGDASDLVASLEELRGDVDLGSARLSRCLNGQAQLLQRLGALEQAGPEGPDLADLADRLGRVEAELALLRRSR